MGWYLFDDAGIILEWCIRLEPKFMKIEVLFKLKDKSAVMSSAKCRNMYRAKCILQLMLIYFYQKKKKKTYADISWGIILYMDDVE